MESVAVVRLGASSQRWAVEGCDLAVGAPLEQLPSLPSRPAVFCWGCWLVLNQGTLLYLISQGNLPNPIYRVFFPYFGNSLTFMFSFGVSRASWLHTLGQAVWVEWGLCLLTPVCGQVPSVGNGHSDSLLIELLWGRNKITLQCPLLQALRPVPRECSPCVPSCPWAPVWALVTPLGTESPSCLHPLSQRFSLPCLLPDCRPDWKDGRWIFPIGQFRAHRPWSSVWSTQAMQFSVWGTQAMQFSVWGTQAMQFSAAAGRQVCSWTPFSLLLLCHPLSRPSSAVS